MNKNTIPETGGVYLLIRNGVVIYVGQTGNLRQRIKGHRVRPFDDVKFTVCENRHHRRRLEIELTRIHNPEMRGKSDPNRKTLRICERLHARIKKHVKPTGMKLEAWTEKQLQWALTK